MKTTVTAKGQITIPAELRRKYGIEPGTKISISDDSTSITLTPVTENLIKQMRGSLKGKSVLESLMQDRLAESEY